MGEPSVTHQSNDAILVLADLALRAMPSPARKFSIEKALRELPLMENGINDEAQLAYMASIEARYTALYARETIAPDYFEKADALWKKVVRTSDQEIARYNDNLFYWYRTSVSVETPSFEARDLFLFRSDPTDRVRRLRVRLLNVFGRSWLSIDELFERFS